jgi:hypothetical protein
MVNWKKLKKFVQKVAKPVAAIAAIVYPPLIPMIGSALGASGAAASVVGAAALSGGASAVAGDSTSDILKNAALGGAAAGVVNAVSPTTFESGGLLGGGGGTAGATTAATAPAATTAASTGTGLISAGSTGTGLTAGGSGLGLSAGGSSLGLTAASPGAAAIGGSLGTELAGISTGIGAAGAGAALSGLTSPASTTAATGAMAPVDYGLTSGAGTAAASSTGILDTLTSAGSSVLDFAKQNPQLTGSILGAIGGAVSAANAPKEQTTTTSIDPQIKAEYLANLERAKAAAAGLGVREFAGFTDDYGLAETQLKNLGLGGKGQQTTDEAARLAMIEAGFTPQQIAAAQADRSAVQDVTGQLGSQYMSAYFNPYEEQVVQGTLGDIERSRQMQDVADRARAVQARAFGGSRQGVQSALTNEAALRQAGTTAAGLRQAGFAQAAQFGQSDAARQLQAQMANQGVSLTLEQANAQLRQQAALANQQAGISGAGLRQSAINQLGNLGAQQQNLGMTGANAVMLAQMERQKLEQQRLDAMRNLPLERLGITGGALGLQPANTGGTTSQPLYTSTLGSALSGGLTGSYIGSLLQPKPQPVP